MSSRCIFALLAAAAVPLLAGCHETVSAAEPQKESGVTWMSSEQVKSAGIEFATAAQQPVDALVLTTGRVAFDDQRVAHVYSPVTGRVASVNAALGQRLKRGAPLATIVSPSVGQWSSDLDKADADLIAAEHDFKRKSDLLAVKAVARADYEASEDAYRQAKAEKDRAQQKAQLLRGAGGASISQGYTLTTPIDGEVIARQLNPGIEVQGQYDSGNPGVELFTVGELDKVWVLADIYEQDLSRVAVGSKVTVRVLAFPNRTFEGVVDWVSGALDPATRTAHVRCVFDNADRALKPEMYANVRIAAAQARTALAVPRSAVVRLGEQAVVYGASTSPDGRTRFELMPVSVDEAVEGSFVPVEHGLEPGTKVVTHGAQALSTTM
jgi:cobalt-zinc-cadmium efflux system membrane fusion protein